MSAVGGKWRLVGFVALALLAAQGVLVLAKRHLFKGKNSAPVENGARYLASAIGAYYDQTQKLPASPDAGGRLSLDELWHNLEPREDVSQSVTFLHIGSGRNWKNDKRFVDAWRRDYVVTVRSLLDQGMISVKVQSCGADGVLGNQDDVIESSKLRTP